ncbi:hypothetical protein [Sporocytophaga myxococcoides]|nr:hypothetical protein [Sporocytophaga myxococcoides]
MSLANNIKRLREESGVLQKQLATEIGLGISHYNKLRMDKEKLPWRF